MMSKSMQWAGVVLQHHSVFRAADRDLSVDCSGHNAKFPNGHTVLSSRVGLLLWHLAAILMPPTLKNAK